MSSSQASTNLLLQSRAAGAGAVPALALGKKGRKGKRGKKGKKGRKTGANALASAGLDLDALTREKPPEEAVAPEEPVDETGSEAAGGAGAEDVVATSSAALPARPAVSRPSVRVPPRQPLPARPRADDDDEERRAPASLLSATRFEAEAEASWRRPGMPAAAGAASDATVAPTPTSILDGNLVFPRISSGANEEARANEQRLERQKQRRLEENLRKRPARELGNEPAIAARAAKRARTGSRTSAAQQKQQPSAPVALPPRSASTAGNGPGTGRELTETESAAPAAAPAHAPRVHRLTMRDLIHDNRTGVPTTAAIARMAETRKKRKRSAAARAARNRMRKEREKLAKIQGVEPEDIPLPMQEEEEAPSPVPIPVEEPLPVPVPVPAGPPEPLALSAPPVAPRIRIVNGRMEVVAESLTYTPSTDDTSATRQYATVHENASRVTSSSFINRTSAEKWSPEELELFYEALAQLGTDFGMIAKLFPNRTRRQVYAKFKKEEKFCKARVERTLQNPVPIDIEKFVRLSGISLDDGDSSDDDESNDVPAAPSAPSSEPGSEPAAGAVA
ncbi:uncharacterized protein AMSG_01827 [Thecamonas trahens ATCC 50062]|uniref:SANT domain-containing protein n=1 Tax=Thecamonas trahens ATCC 50062 TaxID=461836 RepID=A0A0L0DVM7_THETB|nr:hypothetical protein AMSG_01827 [Thecamonas trahens ATCC 50062]KNC55563.1 hypothetical protein AMSG_01827 [Thecamonas trahens ATCC 50062]|eukprot:XP_013761337.1 hypothetical protein AMSG_01827 [Thecamonas trahens ATCC 50062]